MLLSYVYRIFLSRFAIVIHKWKQCECSCCVFNVIISELSQFYAYTVLCVSVRFMGLW